MTRTRTTPTAYGLHWWQKLILNWIVSWSNLATLLVVTTTGHQWEWDSPPDHELERLTLGEPWEP